MLFKNKIEYTKGMFVEIYGTEIKKSTSGTADHYRDCCCGCDRFYDLRCSSAGIYHAGRLLQSWNLHSDGTSVYVSAESDGTFTDEKMQKERTPWRTYPSFTEQVLTMTYEKEGRSTDIPLEELTKVTEFDNFIRITIGGRSTFLDKKRFEIGDAAAFVTWAEDKIAENAEKEEEALALEETEREAPALEDGEAKTEESDEN